MLCFFHVEFFAQPGGSYVALEMNLRPPGGFATDLMNYAADMDVYDLWATILTAGRLPSFQHRVQYHTAHAGRRRARTYRISDTELRRALGETLMAVCPVEPYSADTMGDDAHSPAPLRSGGAQSSHSAGARDVSGTAAQSPHCGQFASVKWALAKTSPTTVSSQTEKISKVCERPKARASSALPRACAFAPAALRHNDLEHRRSDGAQRRANDRFSTLEGAGALSPSCHAQQPRLARWLRTAFRRLVRWEVARDLHERPFRVQRQRRGPTRTRSSKPGRRVDIEVTRARLVVLRMMPRGVTLTHACNTPEFGSTQLN